MSLFSSQNIMLKKDAWISSSMPGFNWLGLGPVSGLRTMASNNPAQT